MVRLWILAAGAAEVKADQPGVPSSPRSRRASGGFRRIFFVAALSEFL